MVLYLLYGLYAALVGVCAYLSFYVWPENMAFVTGMAMAFLLSFVSQLIYGARASRREMREVQRKLNTLRAMEENFEAIRAEYGQANKHGRH